MAKGNKTGGRKPGTPNKITTDLRKRINDFLSDNWEMLQEDFKQLEPKDRVNFYEKILQYGLPRLQSTELTSDIERLTDQQLDYIINDLKKTI